MTSLSENEIMLRDKRFFEVARAVSLLSSFDKARVGCVFVKHSKIISSGVNSVKTHPLQKKYNIHRFTEDTTKHSLHAEVSAYINALKVTNDFSDVTVYIYRETRDGKIAMARPCNSCSHLLKDIGVKTVKYSTYYGYAVEKICEII